MPVDARTTARARLRPGESQRVFRALLDALAHPGRSYELPADIRGRAPMAVVPLLALADLEVTVAVEPDPDGWAAALTLATGAPARSLTDAEWIAFLEPPGADVLATLDRGSAYAPERGTRIVIAAGSLTAPGESEASGGATVVRLTGPGVDGHATFAVDGIDGDMFGALARINAEFPAGIDTWLVTDDGTVVAIPRSSTIDVRDAREGAR